MAIMIPLVTVVILIIVLANIFYTKPGEFNTLPIVIPILAAYMSFSLYRGFRKQQRLLLSYSVTLTDEGITREQLNTPTLSISFMEIKEIIRTPKGGFKIKGLHRTDVILIPYLIDDHEALEACLTRLVPISNDPKDALRSKYKAALFFLALGMMMCVYVLTNPVIVGVCGTLVTGLLGWAFYELVTNKNLPNNSKRALWFIPFMIAGIVYIMYAKLTGTWTAR